jgi:hypothetical protein
VYRGCAEALKVYVPQYSNVKDELDRIKVVNTQASGEEVRATPTMRTLPLTTGVCQFMVPYEISFETNFARRQVAFADPFKLTEKHVEVVCFSAFLLCEL